MTNYIHEKPFDRALRLTDGKTLIVSNGSKWAGSVPDDIETFKDVLKNEILCPRFFEYSLCMSSPWEPISKDVGPLEKWRNAHYFFGNFYKLSHAFQIITLDDDLASELNSLIAHNVQDDEFIRYAEELYADYYLADLDGIKILLEPGLASAAKKGNESAFSGSKYYKRNSVVIEPFSQKIITDLVDQYAKTA